jgi:dTDP-glucose pyrophosphorylase
MLNIVIPMAGAGSRFAKAGYTLPKPLIPVNGVPMIRVVIENLRPSCPHRFIFLAQQKHIEEFSLRCRLSDWAPGCEIVPVAGLTEGAACTVLLAKALIENDDALMIANSDQYVDTDIDSYLSALELNDGLIMTMPSQDPKWSYVGFSESGLVQQVVEKKVISDEATVGIYNYRKGRDFVRAASRMVAEGNRQNGEFYVAPAYDYLISEGARIVTRNVGDAMHGIGIPGDLESFVQTEVCKRATGVFL